MRKIKFGDYCTIEQKRYGADNEFYSYKVIGTFKSNTYVDVPVKLPAEETHHDGIVEVAACMCCGVVETEILRYRIIDINTRERLEK